jgi:hypothetical protein
LFSWACAARADAPVPHIAAGGDNTCIWDSSRVVCWGNPVYGVDDPPTGFRDIQQVGVGNKFACALDADGVWCWGLSGRAGDSVPADLDHPRMIAVGRFHACAIEASGAVRCWSPADFGALVPPIDVIDPRELIVGDYYACARVSSGVRCWGVDAFVVPFVPTDLKNPHGMAAGNSRVCAIDDSGVRCWGSPSGCDPSIWQGRRDVVEVSLGNWACALLSSGELSCDRCGEKPPADLGKVAQLVQGDGHACVTGERGLRCWGDASKGQTLVPVAIGKARSVSVGATHICESGTTGVRCWGDNTGGRADVQSRDFARPAEVYALGGGTCVADDRGLWCRGYDFGSEWKLMPGESRPFHKLARSGDTICGLGDSGFDCWGGHRWKLDGLKQPKDLSVGEHGACAIDRDGIKCAAEPALDADSPYLPQNIPRDLKNPRAIACGDDHACVLDDSGVRCWGRDGRDRLKVPTGLKGPRELAVSFDAASCVLDDDGIKCWGDGSRDLTQNMPRLRHPSSLSLGASNACVIDGDELKCSGDNAYGQLNVPGELLDYGGSAGGGNGGFFGNGER